MAECVVLDWGLCDVGDLEVVGVCELAVQQLGGCQVVGELGYMQDRWGFIR